MNPKPWYASKTLWFNGLTIIVAVATYFGWTPDQSLFQLVSHVLVAVAPAVNMMLRLYTHRPVTFSPSDANFPFHP